MVDWTVPKTNKKKLEPMVPQEKDEEVSKSERAAERAKEKIREQELSIEKVMTVESLSGLEHETGVKPPKIIKKID